MGMENGVTTLEFAVWQFFIVKHHNLSIQSSSYPNESTQDLTTQKPIHHCL
jgi:hypothetical protein